MIESTIDWIQFSTLYREQLCKENDHKEISGFGFYSHGYEDDMGVRRYYGNPNSKKAFVVLSGKTLYNYRALGWDMRDVVEEFLIEGANITRMDLCVTEYIEDNLITVDEISESFQKGEFSGTLTKYGGKQIKGFMPEAPEEWETETTETFYIGSFDRRGKNGIFRAYDKGLELGEFASNLITRLELEERGSNAHNNAKRYANGEKIQDMLNSRITSKSKQWERVIGSDTVDLTRGQQLIKTDEAIKLENRMKWLLNQVAPSLASVIAEKPDFTDIFNRRLQSELLDIVNKK